MQVTVKWIAMSWN